LLDILSHRMSEMGRLRQLTDGFTVST